MKDRNNLIESMIEDVANGADPKDLVAKEDAPDKTKTALGEAKKKMSEALGCMKEADKLVSGATEGVDDDDPKSIEMKKHKEAIGKCTEAVDNAVKDMSKTESDMFPDDDKPNDDNPATADNAKK